VADHNEPNSTAAAAFPRGRQLILRELRMATRFLSRFLDMRAPLGNSGCSVERLNDQVLWDAAPLRPQTPPTDDVPFVTAFPYVAEPW
jgi:hypothetical protein